MAGDAHNIHRDGLPDRILNVLDRSLHDLDTARHSAGAMPSMTPVGDIRRALGTALDGAREAHAHGYGGVDVCRLIADIIDRIVLFAAAPGTGQFRYTLAALGGYGRREMNPFSDTDLLFLIPPDSDETVEPVVHDLLRVLWDLNLVIGHSTRTADECLAAAGTDDDFATSLLEARFLAGDRAHWDAFAARYRTWLDDGAGEALARRKIDAREERLAVYQGTVQVQEPQIKDGPGCLRDIHTARWIAMCRGEGGGIDDLARAGYLFDYELPWYCEDFDFLLRVRTAAHFAGGRATDRLVHLSLPDIAAGLGYGTPDAAAVERFMREFYRRAGRVYHFTGHIIGRFIRRVEGDPCLTGESIDDRGFREDSCAIGFTGSAEDLAADPARIIELFSRAAERNLRVRSETSWMVERAAASLTGGIAELPGISPAFHGLVNLDTGVGRAFRLLREHGVLEKLIPEFAGIAWHYQYNYYHAYTTDEHSIRVVEHLERMAWGAIHEVPELADIMREITARGALYLAGLLHDVGKGDGHNHAARGERLATRALERLNCDPRTVATVRFLVREHLAMSHTAQRRDIDDDETIRDFAVLVRDAGSLRMLTLLTFADLLALSPDALTDWKKTLLLRLYHRTMQRLDRRYEEPSSHTIDRLIRTVVRGMRPPLPEHAVRNHFSLLPEQYLRISTPSQVRGHLRGIASLDRAPVWVSFHHLRNVTLLTVITRDYPRALADICGAIMSSDINIAIAGAQIFTRSDGIIIDAFHVVDINGDSIIPRDMQRELKRNLAAVIGGKTPVTAMIAAHARRWRRRALKVIFREPRIRVHNDISQRYTVVDVFAIDYTGLLYDISRVFADFAIDIHTAKVGTDEDQVADAFYLQQRSGGKIEDPAVIEALTGALMDSLNRAYTDLGYLPMSGNSHSPLSRS